MITLSHKLILASSSPRRKDLLSHCGFDFTIIPADIDEALLTNETPDVAIQRLAAEKASVVANKFPDCIVIGADTDVVLDGEVFGKPESEEEAKSMLMKLQGRKHHVMGGLAVICNSLGFFEKHLSITEVSFLPMSASDIDEYIATKEPFGKAGAYAIQGIAMQYISGINGSYPNVVGLDISKVCSILKQFSC